MTLTVDSEDDRIECFYDSNADKDYFDLTLPTTNGCLVTNKIHKHDLGNIIKTLEKFNKYMTAAGAIKELE